jgi:hypothetical protein
LDFCFWDLPPDEGRATLDGRVREKESAELPPITVGGHYDESLRESKIKRFDGMDKLVLSE